jgi:glycosyltransferase involved in cell wall biosynthesis
VTSVSFFIPAFNCAKTLAETVASIHDGNLQDGDEIVIVNDGSTDATAAVIRDLQSRYPSIRAIDHRFNKGGGAARNTAVENAAHEILFCLDSDNILARASIPRLRQFLLDTSADVAAFRQPWYFVESTSQVTHKWTYKPGQIELADYLAGAVVPGASGNYMFTRDSWLAAKRYPEFAGALDTWGFGLRQVATGQKMLVMPESHYFHRYGHESYWVRESKRTSISLTATQLLIPFFDQLLEQDVDYILGRSGRYGWFDRLDERPLRLKSGQRGVAGIRGDTSEEARSPRGLAQRLRRAMMRVMRYR